MPNTCLYISHFVYLTTVQRDAGSERWLDWILGLFEDHTNPKASQPRLWWFIDFLHFI